jgi:pimeloyl-ACP methyl ester carboxylesterase
MKIYSWLFLPILLLYPQPARAQITDTLIDIGPCQLHFKIIKGMGAPVLFESGGAMDANQWDSIATDFHHTTGATTITYDRQGFGKSGLDTLHYSILNELKGLETGLQQLGYAHKKLILVCHSLGNFYARLYASKHPDLVKGIVMLDPRIPSPADAQHAHHIFANLDQDKLKQQSLTLYYLLRDMEANSNYVSRTILSPNLPIIDIMAEEGPFTSAADNQQFKTDQKNFIKQFSNGKLVFANGSTHNIARDKPGLVTQCLIPFYKKYH